MKEKLKNFLLDLFFPKFCFGCKKEGTFLCQDCQAILDISNSHQEFQTENLSDLYYPLEYKNPLIKNLIKHFKYEPFVKELAKDLASLIITHFQLIDPSPNFEGEDYVLLPVPLEKRKLKWRGFNQSEEIGKELSKFLNIEILNNVLIKIKETPPQVELSEKEREENIKGVFIIRNREKILGKKILLVDDVYTTGSTMKECAQVLKKAGTKEVIGIVIARAKPEEDQF
jgi:ComF family protein